MANRVSNGVLRAEIRTYVCGDDDGLPIALKEQTVVIHHRSSCCEKIGKYVIHTTGAVIGMATGFVIGGVTTFNVSRLLSEDATAIVFLSGIGVGSVTGVKMGEALARKVTDFVFGKDKRI